MGSNAIGARRECAYDRSLRSQARCESKQVERWRADASLRALVSPFDISSKQLGRGHRAAGRDSLGSRTHAERQRRR
jgi:hypothetical protein